MEIDRKVLRKRDGRFCQLEIKLKDGRLSICGTEGRIERRAAAKKQALEYWRNYFDEEPAAIQEMNKSCGTRFTSSTGAARYVVQTDGEFHGLDVLRADGNEVLCAESGGQILEEIADWFPEARPLLPWHLNDMKAGCEHQEALGWGHGNTIALDRSSATEMQIVALDHYSFSRVKHQRALAAKRMAEKARADRHYRMELLRKLHKAPTISDEEMFTSVLPSSQKEAQRVVSELTEKEIPDVPFEAEIFKDSLGAPCPTCGYRYGTAWLKRELPAEVVELAASVCA